MPLWPVAMWSWNPLQPTFRSLLRGARAPWGLSGNAGVSASPDWLRFGGSDGARSHTQLASVSVHQDLGRHGLHAEWHELRPTLQLVPTRSR